MPRTVPVRSLNDTLACTAAVGSPAAANSCTQNVRAKKPRASGFGSSRINAAPSMVPRGSKRISAPEEIAVDLPGASQVANLLEPREGAVLVGFLIELDLLEACAQFLRSHARIPGATESGQLAGNLVERHAVTAVVGTGLTGGELAAWENVGNDLRNLPHPIVLRIRPDIEDLPVHRTGRSGKHTTDGGRDVLDVHDWPPRAAVADHDDALGGPSQRTKVVEHDVETHARRCAVGGRITQKRNAKAGAGQRLHVALHHDLALGVGCLRIHRAALIKEIAAADTVHAAG